MLQTCTKEPRKVSLHVRLGQSEVERLDELARKTPWTRAAIAREILRRGLAAVERKGPQVLLEATP